MSDRSMWKMLHLLHTLKPGQTGLNDQQLIDVGIDCGPDTVNPLVAGGAVIYENGIYALSGPAQTILSTCIVANRRWSSDDMWVDFPSAFVIMPFSQAWSNKVYSELLEPGIEDAGLKCVRGDTIVRIGDLTQNIWGALLHAGIVVADVSILNANVFYELGLAHAIGKDTIVLKQSKSVVPADIGGAHYHEYDLQALELGKEWLSAELSEWAKNNNSEAVRNLREM